MCVCVCVCMCVCVDVCMYVCVYAYMRICVYLDGKHHTTRGRSQGLDFVYVRLLEVIKTLHRLLQSRNSLQYRVSDCRVSDYRVSDYRVSDYRV
jgi:hypothetical protein